MYRSDMTAIDLVETILYYNYSCSEFLLPLLETVIEHINEDTSLTAYEIIDVFGEKVYLKDFIGEDIFGLIVLIYGEYGIRPSAGWIEDLVGFKKLIMNLIRREVNYG